MIIITPDASGMNKKAAGSEQYRGIHATFESIPRNKYVFVMPALRFIAIFRMGRRPALRLPAGLLFAAMLLLNACTEEVDLYTDSTPTPIVYCLLNPADSIQYLRIGRSYQAGEGIATVPPLADSTVWNIPHEIYMEEYTDGVRSNTWRFEPDNAIPKDSGFFPVAGLRIYTAAFRPLPGRMYHLYAYFPDLNKMASAVCSLHGIPQIADPLPLSVRKINFEPGQPYVIRWFPGENTGVYQMTFRVHYRDSSSTGWEFHNADYSNGGLFNQKEDEMIEASMGGQSFFSAMAAVIPVIPGVARTVISVEFIMISGGTDLGFLFRSSTETGSNFTNLAEYSNVRNGLGVFSSRVVIRVPNLALSNVTVDMLAHGEITRSLGFKDSQGN
jgi:hypothetical protein